MRGRPSKQDSKKILLILNVLKKYPDGAWLRLISQETHLPVSTIFYYLNKVLESFVESIGYRNEQGRYIGVRIIKLKQGKENTQLDDVLKYLELKKRIKLSANQGKGSSNSSKGVES